LGIICEDWDDDDDDGTDVKHEDIWICIHMTMLVHRRITTDDDDGFILRLGPDANANLLGFILEVGSYAIVKRKGKGMIPLPVRWMDGVETQSLLYGEEKEEINCEGVGVDVVGKFDTRYVRILTATDYFSFISFGH